MILDQKIVQGVPAFRDFPVRDTHYFVIIFPSFQQYISEQAIIFPSGKICNLDDNGEPPLTRQLPTPPPPLIPTQCLDEQAMK